MFILSLYLSEMCAIWSFLAESNWELSSVLSAFEGISRLVEWSVKLNKLLCFLLRRRISFALKWPVKYIKSQGANPPLVGATSSRSQKRRGKEAHVLNSKCFWRHTDSWLTLLSAYCCCSPRALYRTHVNKQENWSHRIRLLENDSMNLRQYLWTFKVIG